jgi:cellulose synthase/poly-beta-1,6-N-acetylglucosamine synthase-like glycosyltransferase
MIELIFFVVFGLLVYTYFLYPALLFCITRLVGRKPLARADYLPGVSLLIAAHNEEAVIENKILNCLSLDYPPDKLEIVIASDGSSDATNAIARRYVGQGITLYEYPRGGKIKALNQTVPKVQHEVIVFSDANTMYQPDSIKHLVGYLADGRVGAVTGDVRLINPHATLGQPEGMYFKYERFIQECESRLGAVIGVDGAMYAIRRDLYVPPPEKIVCDDFVISMNVLRSGHRVVYAPAAVAYEDATCTPRQELWRRARYTSATMQALFSGQGLPRYYQLRLWFMYLSHKFLRWQAPILLAALFILNMFCLGSLFWNISLTLQCAFYFLAAWGFFLPGRTLPFFLRIPYYFTLQNVGNLLGVLRAIVHSQAAAWRSPDRSVGAVALPRIALDGQREGPSPASQ